ncbi:Sec-independent protein translocase protein TatB [Azospirillaceae bacterium]
MFDIGWSEILLTVVVALIVIGPKDLPKTLYEVGKWVRQIRLMAGEFHHNIGVLMHEAELDELRRQALAARDAMMGQNLEHNLEQALDPTGTVRAAMEPPLDGYPGSPPEAGLGAEMLTGAGETAAGGGRLAALVEQVAGPPVPAVSAVPVAEAPAPAVAAEAGPADTHTQG